MTRPDEAPDDAPEAFIPLADYAAPGGPVGHLARRLLDRVRRVLASEEAPVVEDEGLREATRATVDDHMGTPDCAPLVRELDATLDGWATGGRAAEDTLRLVVLPPGDPHGLLAGWAARRAHAVLEPPSFDALLAPRERSPLDAAPGGDGVLVVPRLERWFVRHRNGLAHVRALLAELAAGERRCVVGCNSWAWLYLARAVEADLLLPPPLTFAPFDAPRLHRWLAELAVADGTRDVVFRTSGSGTDVFARDADDGFESDFLPGLAARSRGVPWVAWRQWRRGLRTRREGADGDGEDGPEDDADGADADGPEDTLWLVETGEPVLPIGHERTARLVLHALLLHGELATAELARVLPVVGESNIVPALARAGFVERADGRYRCATSAYPAIFESLATAGLSTPAC